MCSRCYFVIKSIGTNMFREYVILLCAGSFVSGIAVNSGGQNAPAKSQAPNAGAAQQQDRLALPSQVSYQNIAAPSSKYLPNSRPSYQVNSAVVDTIAEATPPKLVPVQSYGSPNVQQQAVSFSASVASDPSSPEYNNILTRYAPVVQPIKPYFAAPVAAKSVSIGSQGAANDGHGAQASDGYITRPFVVYTNNAAQSGQYFAVPTAQAVVEQQRSVNIHPLSSQGTQYGAPAVAQPTNSAPRPFYPANNAILESHGVFTAQSPTVASYQVNQVNQVQPVNRPPPQYLPGPEITYNVNPTVKTVSVPVPVAKKLTLEAYNTVQSHPPLAPKYAPVPIPIPVIYQQLETHNPAQQQFVVVPTSASYAQAPVGVQPIPVPVYTTNGARLQYHSIPVNGGHQQGYAKAVLFSPASEVSRVTFNGLGVTYGW